MSLILVVDDESDVEMLFRQQFRRELRAGLFRMDFALSADSALQRMSDVAAASLILILSDINMPGIAGYELAEQAKRLRPGVKPILISGRETDGYGFPLLRKPFMQQDLARLMKETTGLC